MYGKLLDDSGAIQVCGKDIVVRNLWIWALDVFMHGEDGLTARGGHGKTRRGQKVQRGHNLSNHAQLPTPLSFMHMQRIYNPFFFPII